ncbi:MAG: outer membrane beta-barrel protein [Chitinispirillales bacterium]|jgi:opacity protein-like surface antigen|nr:outer membrane beta-barrel protein [Chitinispirillales bacterium]
MRKALVGVVAGVMLGAFSMVSAVELSAGVSGVFGMDFGAGLLGISEKWDDEEFSTSVPWTGGGFNVFFDATYAELGVGLTFGGGKPKLVYNGKDITSEEYGDEELKMSFTALNLSLVGKYPIAIANNMTIFPLAGIEYKMVLSGKTTYGNEEEKWDGKTVTYGDEFYSYTYADHKASEFSRFGLKFGAGMDIALNDNMFLRPVVAYNLRFANKISKDEIDGWEEWADDDDEVKATMGHGLTISVGLGFRF